MKKIKKKNSNLYINKLFLAILVNVWTVLSSKTQHSMAVKTPGVEIATHRPDVNGP